MRKFLGLLLVFGAFGCEKFSDITEEDGPCTIFLKNGTTIETQGNIEILESTLVITYRDADGKLWSIPPQEYKTYSCGSK